LGGFWGFFFAPPPPPPPHTHHHQVAASHYQWTRYIDKARWASFFHQVDEAIRSAPKSLLEVGVGSGLTGTVLKQQGVLYTSLDFDPALKPDVVASLLDMPFEDASFDTVCCYEVLEHLPFDDFPRALDELFRVARTTVIVSLPNARPVVRLQLPKIAREKMFPLFWKRSVPHTFDGQHYWEINKKATPLRIVMDTMISHAAPRNFAIIKDYRVWACPYHHFFVFVRQ
jgi:SAM-dependent methyltransferase